MRLLSRAALLGALAATAAAGPAMAADAPLTVTSTGKKGTLLLGSPTTFTLKGTFPSITPTLTATPACSRSKPSCPIRSSSTRRPLPVLHARVHGQRPDCLQGNLEDRHRDADRRRPAEEVQGDITAKAISTTGTGFTVLSYVDVDKPSPIKEKVIGELRSSVNAGNYKTAAQTYGLEMYIPVTPALNNPIGSLYPS